MDNLKILRKLVALLLAMTMLSGCGKSETVSTGNGGGSVLLNGKYTVDPMEDKADSSSSSGEKGNVYYLSLEVVKLYYSNDAYLQYDTITFISSLQGVLNREKPTLFFDYTTSTDQFWYKYLKREDKLLYGYKQTVIKSFEEFLQIFSDEIKEYGIVLWDDEVAATSNVAATVCSATNSLPIRKGSTLETLVKDVTGASVNVDLSGKFTGKGMIPDTSRASTGSKKCDAYIWTLEKYGDSLDWSVLGYYLDAMEESTDNPYPSFYEYCLPNHDYIIAKKGFFFDLSPWADETPYDDKTQPLGTDYNTLCEILNYAYTKNNGEFYTVCGYVPWPKKYTDTVSGRSIHEAVDAEWKFAEICTSYNAVLDADSAPYGELANASLYTLSPLKESYENNHPEVTEEYSRTKKYVMIYMGDYDSAAWTAKQVPTMWRDSTRGSQEITWSFNLNLSDRIPMVFDYLYEYKTDVDYFLGADSGVGYVMSNAVINRTDSNNPSGEEQYISYASEYLKKFDVNYCGFIIATDNIGEDVFKMYGKIGFIGFNHELESLGNQILSGVSAVRMVDLPEKDSDGNSAKTSGDYILNQIKFNNGSNLYAFRSILWTPSQIKALKEYVCEKNEKIVFCNPETFVAMANAAAGNK